MAKVITFSRTFPAYHPHAGQRTYFVEKFWKSLGGEMKHGIYPSINIDYPYSDRTYYEMRRIMDQASGVFENERIVFAKNHTIRAGERWKVGDMFSPRVWSDRPYNSPMIIIAPDTKIVKTWDFEIKDRSIYVDGKLVDWDQLAENDGLSVRDLMEWFKWPKPFKGQIICWNESVNY